MSLTSRVNDCKNDIAIFSLLNEADEAYDKQFIKWFFSCRILRAKALGLISWPQADKVCDTKKAI